MSTDRSAADTMYWALGKTPSHSGSDSLVSLSPSHGCSPRTMSDRPSHGLPIHAMRLCLFVRTACGSPAIHGAMSQARSFHQGPPAAIPSTICSPAGADPMSEFTRVLLVR